MIQRVLAVVAVCLSFGACELVAGTIIEVSPVAGSPTASGTALLNALAAIVDNSAARTYVIKLDPGTYGLGATELVMKPYVDIEGSGEDSTVLSGSGNNDTGYATAIVKGAVAAELRNLQVASQGAGFASSIGVYVPPSTSFSLREVTIVAGGATATWGVRNVGASPSIQDVTINLFGGGSQAYGIGTTSNAANPSIKHTVINVTGTAAQTAGIFSDGVTVPQEMRDLEINMLATGAGAYGIYVSSFGAAQTFLLTGSVVNVSGATNNYGIVFHGNAGGVFNVETSYLKASGSSSWGVYAPSTGSVTFDNSEVTGATYSIQAAGTAVSVGASRIAGTVSGASAACAGAYSAAYGALSSTCH